VFSDQPGSPAYIGAKLALRMSSPRLYRVEPAWAVPAARIPTTHPSMALFAVVSR